MKKIALIVTCIALTVTNIILLSTRNSTAQQAAFFNVLPFMTQAGRMGFFNQEDGTIYIYDSDVKELLFKAQLKELGTPIDHLERNDLPEDNKFGGKSKSIIVPTNDKKDQNNNE